MGFEPTLGEPNTIGCLRSKRWAEPIESHRLRQKKALAKASAFFNEIRLRRVKFGFAK